MRSALSECMEGLGIDLQFCALLSAAKGAPIFAFISLRKRTNIYMGNGKRVRVSNRCQILEKLMLLFIDLTGQ